MGIGIAGVIPLRYFVNSASAASLVFLLRDEFITDEAAPLTSPRTCEPGPGIGTVVDTNNITSITSGQLQWVGVAAVNYEDPRITFGGISRATGVALVYHVNTAAEILPGWRASQGVDPTLIKYSSYWQLASNISAYTSGTFIDLALVVTSGVDYEVGLILRSTGCFFVIKGGSQFPSWTLLWMYVTGTEATLYPALQHGAVGEAGLVKHSHIRAINLPNNGYTVWGDDYGIATERYAGAVSAGQAFTHEANCLIEWTQTTMPTAGSTEVDFRKQDANNYWAIVVTAGAPGNLQLWEVVGGVGTMRADAGGVVSAGHRIVIIADGTTIRGYNNDVLRWTYSSASNFQTQTSGELAALGTNGAVSDLVSWPRTLSGLAASALEAVSA